jgi:hypothetical protein
MKNVIFAVVLLIAATARAEWHDYPNAPDTFSGNGTLKWTVDLSQNGSAMSYKVVDGDELRLNIAIVGSSLVGVGNALIIKLPAGMIVGRYVAATAVAGGLLPDGDQVHVEIGAAPDEDEIYVSPWNGVFSCGHSEPFQVSLFGQISIPLKQ